MMRILSTEDKGKVLKRRKLREEILMNLYNYYFENKGEYASVVFENTEEGNEERLAYLYLSDLGLITTQGMVKTAKITAHGINKVESEIK